MFIIVLYKDRTLNTGSFLLKKEGKYNFHICFDLFRE